MLRPKTIGLVNQRRTLRALYAQTQAYPYAARLAVTADTDANGVPTGSDSQITLALSDGTTGVGLFPGAVMEAVAPSASPGGDSGEVQVKLSLSDSTPARPFGLSANFVGGNMDELNGNREIGVWRGRGGVFEVLAPVFVSTLAGTDFLGANAIGQLADVDYGTAEVDGTPDLRAARLLSFLSERAIIVELMVGG